MQIMAVLSGAGVRRDLLHAAGQAGVLASGGHQVGAAVVDRALDQLADWSLLTFSSTARPSPCTAWCRGWSGRGWPADIG